MKVKSCLCNKAKSGLMPGHTRKWHKKKVFHEFLGNTEKIWSVVTTCTATMIASHHFGLPSYICPLKDGVQLVNVANLLSFNNLWHVDCDGSIWIPKQKLNFTISVFLIDRLVTDLIFPLQHKMNVSYVIKLYHVLIGDWDKRLCLSITNIFFLYFVSCWIHSEQSLLTSDSRRKHKITPTVPSQCPCAVLALFKNHC